MPAETNLQIIRRLRTIITTYCPQNKETEHVLREVEHRLCPLPPRVERKAPTWHTLMPSWPDGSGR